MAGTAPPDPVLRSTTDGVEYVSLGWVVVAQDSRGHFGAEVIYEPFHVEREDGFDTVELCAARTSPVRDPPVGRG